MEHFTVTAVLVAAVVLPVALFWLLKSRSPLNGWVAAAVAVATGWALNVVWALASQGSAPNDLGQGNGDTLAIAMRFGWACPAVLTFLTWLFWHFKRRRTAWALTSR